MKSSRSILSISILISIGLLALSASSHEVGMAGSPQWNPSPQHDLDSGCGNENNPFPAPEQTAPNSGKHCVELRIDTPAESSFTSNPIDEPLVPLDSVSMILDDDQVDTRYGVSDGYDHAEQFIWLNRFTPDPAVFPFTLDQIWVMFWEGNIQVGDAIDLVVYQDLDGNPPDNAAWLATYHKVVQAIDGSTWSVYSLNPPIELNGPGDVLIGVVNRFVNSGVSPMSNPASLDETSTQRRSWRGWWFSDPPDPPILPPDMEWGLIDDSGYPGNWMIRGYGETPISAPNLITPANGATIKDNTPQFDWSSVTGATLYKLQVDNDMNFSNPEVNITTSNSTYTLTPAMADEKFYWRVQARNGSGIWGIWSSPTWSFTINSMRKLFLPISMKEYVSFFEGPEESEPNNDWQHANGPIRAGKEYYGYPDEKDYFSFIASDSGSIVVDLTDHTGQGVQLQLFHQDVDHRVAWDHEPPFHLELTNQSPGWYYIYIFSKSGHNQVNKYTLKANFP